MIAVFIGMISKIINTNKKIKTMATKIQYHFWGFIIEYEKKKAVTNAVDGMISGEYSMIFRAI